MDLIFEQEKYYHVFNHANGIENLFSNDDNYRYFLTKYAHYIEPVCQTYAYCLMPNHFHFLVKIRSEEVLRSFYIEKQRQKHDFQKIAKVQQESESFDIHKCVMQEFQNFLNAYAKAYNKKYNRKGNLYIHSLKRKEVDSDTYLAKVIHYIHYNPLHHGFCKNILDWHYSSIHAFLEGKKSKIAQEEVLEWFGNTQAFWKFHEQTIDKFLEKEMEFLE